MHIWLVYSSWIQTLNYIKTYYAIWNNFVWTGMHVAVHFESNVAWYDLEFDQRSMIWCGSWESHDLFILRLLDVNISLLCCMLIVTNLVGIRCLNSLPEAVGDNPAHFDLSLARGQPANGHLLGDWLVLQLQELISLAYQVLNILIIHLSCTSILCTQKWFRLFIPINRDL